MTAAELAREVAKLDPTIGSEVDGARVMFSMVVRGKRYALGVDTGGVGCLEAADVAAAAAELRKALAGGPVVG